MSRTSQLDKFAILLSGICLVHCLVAPLALTLIPIFSLTTFVEDVVFHRLMLWVVVPTSIVALFIGCKKHRLWSIALSGVFGIGILFAVAFLGHDHISVGAEKVATSIGGLLLALSHYLNYKACQSITCESSNCTQEHHH